MRFFSVVSKLNRNYLSLRNLGFYKWCVFKVAQCSMIQVSILVKKLINKIFISFSNISLFHTVCDKTMTFLSKQSNFTLHSFINICECFATASPDRTATRDHYKSSRFS